MHPFGRSLFAALALGLVACGSDDEEIEELEGLAVVSISALPDARPPGFEVAEAWISFDQLELVPCSANEGSIALEDYPLDLLSDPPSQALYGTGLLEYCAIHLELAPLSYATEVQDLSALVRGTREDGSLVEIESRTPLAIDVRGERFDARQLTLGFDLSIWLGNVDVDAAEPDDSGRILIDADHNAELLAPFEADLGRAPALYQDPDADGIVDEDELTPVATPE